MNKDDPAHIHNLFLDSFNAGDIESLGRCMSQMLSSSLVNLL
jgi:hypothetical protein